jgi:hypothetical protein
MHESPARQKPKTKGRTMKEIDYKDFFWQNDLVRLRPIKPEDWEAGYYSKFDSAARRLLKCEVELPPSAEPEKRFITRRRPPC